MNKSIVILIFILQTCLTSKMTCQNIIIQETNNNIVIYPLNSIKKIGFVANSMNFHFNNGNLYSHSLSSINKYWYENSPTSIKDSQNETVEFTIFPNPSTSQITLNYHIDTAEEFTITIIDKLGRIINEQKLTEKNPGLHSSIINIQDQGYYFCRLSLSKGTKTLPIIIQK